MRNIDVLLINETGIPSSLLIVRSLASYSKQKFRVHVLSSKIKDRDVLRYSRFVVSYKRIKYIDELDFIDQICDYVKKIKAHILFPIKEQSVSLISRHKNKFEKICCLHPTPEYTEFNTLTHKLYLHNYLVKNNYVSPKTYDCNCLQNKQISELNFPILLKPSIGYGGKGIKMIQNPDELEKTLQQSASLYKNHIFQHYIAGSDIDISILCSHGEILAYTIQKGILNDKLKFSPSIQFVKDARLLHIVEKLISSLNWSGIAHLDFRYSEEDQRYYLLDFNARYWSTLLGSVNVGVNFPILACLTAMNIKFDRPSYKEETFMLSKKAIRYTFINFFRKGRIPVKFSQTQLKYTLKDPVPEIVSMFRSRHRN